ncbi:MAG: glycoside hydrolase family 10 protein [Flammeovirgaceae bacterium]
MKTLSYILIFNILFIYNVLAQNFPKRELRGAWIATVANIDFPSKKGLSKQSLKSELIQILDSLESFGFNTVIFQVRPSADAFYKSKTEPWSEWLSGQQGVSTKLDVLKFLVEESHKRGLEVHAWFNPFRVVFDSKSSIHPKSIASRHPEWLVSYGKGKMLNPALPEARQYIVQCIMEVVNRYDIDAVHFDDYFYPYPKKNQPFPDSASFKKYGADFKNIADWRRENINSLIQSVHLNLQKAKPHIKFGISPFGVWRNKREDALLGSDTRASIPTYDSLYADTRLWLEKGWIDYIAPQLYWTINFKIASYQTLLNWWCQNSFDRHLYIGHALYKVDTDSAWKNLSEIPNQIKLQRNSLASGSIFFSMNHLLKNRGGMADTLKTNYYSSKTLIPSMSWKDTISPSTPSKAKVKFKRDELILKWKKSKNNSSKVWQYVVFENTDNELNNSSIVKVLPSKFRKLKLKKSMNRTYGKFGIVAVNRNYVMSKPILFEIKK